MSMLAAVSGIGRVEMMGNEFNYVVSCFIGCTAPRVLHTGHSTSGPSRKPLMINKTQYVKKT